MPLIWEPMAQRRAYVNSSKFGQGESAPHLLLGNCPLYRLESTNKRKFIFRFAPQIGRKVSSRRPEGLYT